MANQLVISECQRTVHRAATHTEPHTPIETLKANVDSLLTWGLIRPRKGVDNYSRHGNVLELEGQVTWTANLTSPAALAKL
jgi:hypothetical protein